MSEVWSKVEEMAHRLAVNDDQKVKLSYREVGVGAKILRMGWEWCAFSAAWSEDLQGLYCRRINTHRWRVWACSYEGKETWRQEGASLRDLLFEGKKVVWPGKRAYRRQ